MKNSKSLMTYFISVAPGRSVVTWQKVFAGKLYDHNAVFQSNILADTDSPDVHLQDHDVYTM